MAKSQKVAKAAGKTPISTSQANPKRGKSRDGLAEIDSLFAEKHQSKQDARQNEQAEQQQRQRQPRHKPDENAPPKKAISLSLTNSRADLEKLNTISDKKEVWASDGLGGVFNGEGYTGRREGGQRVFKAHLMNREGFGGTKDCPFDCDCCFI